MDTPPKTGGEYKKQSDMQKITCGQNIPLHHDTDRG